MLRNGAVARCWFVLVLVWSFAAGDAIAAEPLVRARDNKDFEAKARDMHQRATTLDSHVDIAGPQYATPQLNPGVDNPQLKCDLAKMSAGGVDGVFLAAYVPQKECNEEGYRRAYQAAMDKVTAIRRLTTTMYPDRCVLAASPDDVERIVRSGKRAIMIGIENGYAIGTDLSNIRRFHDLGVRYITLCHNGHNQVCDSCNPSAKLGDAPTKHGGLSPFGRQVVAEMNRLGIMIDVSHAAASTFRDVVQLSKAPVIASHSGCAALCDHPRDLTDAQLQMLKANGGVIQIVALSAFLRASPPERKKAIADLEKATGVREVTLAAASPDKRERFQAQMRQIDERYPPVGVKDFADHIDHAVHLIGAEHVGIGTDFDGGGGIRGFNSHAEAPNVTLELVCRGYDEGAIMGIWGKNLLRVWRDVESKAKDMAQR